MAIKVDRPADFGGNGIVVYVAKSPEEVDRCRAGLTEAGIPVELPEAAIEALFAAGRTQIPVRVNPEFFKEAQKIMDELYPPPVLELPPDDDERAASAAKASTAPGAIGDPDGDDRRGPVLAGAQLEVARQQGTDTRVNVEEKVPTAIGLAAASFILPGLGLLTGAWATYSAWWCMDRLKTGSLERGNAKLAFGMGIAAMVSQPISCFAIAWKLGVFA